MIRLLTALVLLAASAFAGGLDEVMQEPDLVKRFEKAILLAETDAKAAHELVKDNGSRSELMRTLDEIAAASKLSLQSLRDTGKRPGKLSKQYKKGELKTQAIVRRLKDLILALGYEDRPAAEKVRDEVMVTHEEFLLGVMTGK